MVDILTIACILSGIILVFACLWYFFIRVVRANPRNSRFERHELQLQGPILEVDNNGFISDNNGITFKEKLLEALRHLEPDQKIARKHLSLDIDAIIGIGHFGDVIKGQIGTTMTIEEDNT
jgi:endothelial-specific receptor tyrosine kinase